MAEQFAPKDYRVTVAVKNNRILSAAEEMGYANVAKLSRASGIDRVAIDKLVNLKMSPYARNGDILRIVKRLCEFMALSVEDLFSEEQLTPLLTNRATVEADYHQMLAMNRPELVKIVHDDGFKRAISASLSNLKPRERKVLELRYGLDGGDERTLEEIAGVLDVTRERIRQMEAKALRKLRSPYVGETAPLREYFVEQS